MKNSPLCVLVAALFLLLPNMTYAGYSIKKTHTLTVQQTAATNAISNATCF